MAGWLEGPTGRVEQVTTYHDQHHDHDHDHDDHDDDQVDDHDYVSIWRDVHILLSQCRGFWWFLEKSIYFDECHN